MAGSGFPRGGGANPTAQHTILPKFPKNCIKLKEFGPGGCCNIGQNDTIGKIELNPAFVLSSDNTNYKNNIQ